MIPRPTSPRPGAGASPATILALLLAGLAGGCLGTRTKTDSTLLVQTTGGRELGVSTTYGVVFLGYTARSGDVQLTAWFGDGPSIEASVIEPVGGGVYTIETEIRLPETRMSFQTPEPGTTVVVVGRDGRETWEAETVVGSDPRVEGLILEMPEEDDNLDDAGQIGAGVYIDLKKPKRRLLVGLVSGRVRIIDPNGRGGTYLTVMGPDKLWRLVTYRREFSHKRRWIYREDIL